jgi:hypothetical protein
MQSWLRPDESAADTPAATDFQCRLEHADVESSVAQCQRRRMRGDKLDDDFDQASITSVSCRRSRNPWFYPEDLLGF